MEFFTGLFVIIIPLVFISLSITAWDSLGGIGVLGGIITGLSFCMLSFCAFAGHIGTFALICTVFGAMGLWMMTKGYEKNKH